MIESKQLISAEKYENPEKNKRFTETVEEIQISATIAFKFFKLEVKKGNHFLYRNFLIVRWKNTRNSRRKV